MRIRSRPLVHVTAGDGRQAYVSIRQHTSAYAYVCMRIRSRPLVHVTAVHGRQACVSIRQHTSAYVSIRQHTSAYVSIRQHTPTSALDTRVARHRQCHRSRWTRRARRSSAPCRAACACYVSIRIRTQRQHTHTHTTSAYLSIFSAVPRCMRMLCQHTHTHTRPAYADACLLTHSIHIAYA
jgi:hypothetical protein